MAKALIICSDGTWNNPKQKDRGRYRPSNVVKMKRAVAPRDKSGREQIVFYDPGVGTGGKRDKFVAGLTGKGLSKNVKDCYLFLINNFQPGDEIYCFGFSRGAYTVRSLAGLIGTVGLLQRDNWELYHDAYDLYRKRKKRRGARRAERFQTRNSQPCTIKFLGVWDTVGALGIPVGWFKNISMRRHGFHDVTLSPHIPYAFHALAIDERRKAFKPAIWRQERVEPGQTVEQVWFSGVHSNVGGGYANTGLADLAFLWMKERAESAGLFFDADYIRDRVRPNPRGELRNSMKWYYRPLGQHIRGIGLEGNAEESVHTSAVERFTGRPRRYHPDNLGEAQEKGISAFPPVESEDEPQE